MTRKKHLYLLLDTETVGGFNNPLIYDIGGAIIDRQGNVYDTFTFVIKEIWNDISLLKSAYYKEKLPQYMSDLLENKRILVNFSQAIEYINNLCEKYEIKAIIAHYMDFDYKAIKNTFNHFINEEMENFILNYPLWCTCMMSLDVIATKKRYQAYCKENNYMTKHKKPRPQVKAEILYKYISNNNDFKEKHTSIDDVMIEVEIFKYCIKQKKKMNKVYKACY